MNALISIENIGPEKAKLLLGNLFEGQRKLRLSGVKKFADEMKAGRFRLSQDAIVIVNGKLANGQHRLNGVVEAGQEYPFLVLRTNDPEIYKVIDDGMKRTTGDVLQGVSSACLVAAIASATIQYDLNMMSIRGHQVASKGKILEYVYQHTDSLQRAATEVLKLQSKQRLMAGSVMGAFLEIGGRHDWDSAFAFMSEVITGEGSVSACKILREKLIRDRMSRSRLNQAFIFAITIKAYSAYFHARELKVLKMLEDEPMPQFPGS